MLPIPNPIAFTVFGVDIRWYAIMLTLGIFSALIFLLSRCEKWGVSKDTLTDYFIWLIPLSILGARLYYVLFEWSYYSKNLTEIFAIRNGGLAIHGGLLTGILVTIVFCRIKKIQVLKFMDLAIPAVALGQAIGRWGNYFNMEAHGVETDLPWAIPVIDASGLLSYVHPTFLYESVWDLLVFVFLVWFEKNKETYYGEGFCWYLVLYSVGRFFVEGLRTDSLMFLGLRQAQILSLVLILVGIVGLVLLRKFEEPFQRNGLKM